MKEREREEIYWKLSLLLLILSPLVILLFFKNNIEFSFSPPVYIISMILSIPIIFVTDIIMHLLKGKVPKFNIKSPTVKESNETKENMEKSLEEIIKRLNKLGFYIEAESYEITDNVISCLKETFNNDERFSSLRSMGKKWALKDEIFKALKNLKFTEEEIREILNYIAAYSSEEGKELRFDKGQTGHAHGYLDQIFSGIVTLKQDHFRLNIEAEVTMKDTLIMDSGEGEFLSSLCNYINLKNPDYDFKNVPLTLYCGLILTLISGFLAIPAVFYPHLLPYVFSIAAGGEAMLLFMLIFVMAFRRDLLGFRLVLAGLYTGAVPYIYVLVEYMRSGQIPGIK